MLKLRRGVVRSVDPLEVEIEGELRRAWADLGLVGPCEIGDEVVCNVCALDLDLGSGGFDIVHVNLTRGLEGGNPPEGVHVIKLNYSSLQHPVDPVELPVESPPRPERPMPVAVISLHGQLAPLCWAAAAAGLRRVGFVQAAGGALPAGLSRDVAELRDRELLCDQISVGSVHGAPHEAISLTGAIHAAAAGELGWDAAVVGPGPGMLGSNSRYGHGGMAALDGCHAALGLGLEPVVAPRLSSGDPRQRHLGFSHHTRSVLELCLGSVTVAVPEGLEALWPAGLALGSETAVERIAAFGHRIEPQPVELEEYAASGLPTRTMGREFDDDRLFFASPLAAGSLLGSRAAAFR